MNNIDPVFIKITENLDTTDIPDDLSAEPIQVRVGDELSVVARNYVVHKARKEDGSFDVKKSKDDLRRNIRAYEELVRAGVIADFPIDDLYLKDQRNGNVLIEIEVPPEFYKERVYSKWLETRQKNFFVRLDGSMLNTKFRDQKKTFEQVEVKTSPCMFASDAALAITKSGQEISLVERSLVIEEEIQDIYIHPRFTLYEREIISRLAGTINLLAHNKKIDRVTTTLPRGAYYSFLFQAAADGYLSPSLVLRWFDEVDKRVKYLNFLLKKGVHRYHPQLPIERYSFMDSACEAMRNYFQEKVGASRADVSMDELFELVMQTIQEKDSFARQVFESGFKLPSSFRELADFTYAVSNLTDMELIESEPLVPKLVIGVYDITEVILWSVTRQIRNRGLLEHRGQFNSKQPNKTTYDHLSYVCVMPIEHITFDLSPEFVKKYMGGSAEMYSVARNALPNYLQEDLLSAALGFEQAEDDVE